MSRFQVLLIFAFLGASFANASHSACGTADWQLYLDEKCLKVIEEFHAYNASAAACKSLGDGALPVSIHSIEEQNFIAEYLFKSKKLLQTVWVGGQLIGSNQVQWADGSKVNVSQTSWTTGSPRNKAEKACVEMLPEGTQQGKFHDESCTKPNMVLCQKAQSWSLLQMQQTLLAMRKSFDDELANERLEAKRVEKTLLAVIEQKEKQHQAELQKTKTDLQSSLESQRSNLQNSINVLHNNPVPIGFIYVQLPNQPDPKSLWPMAQWTDVTGQYAGVFFRAEGGGSAPFGQLQGENAPRVAQVKASWDDFHLDSTDVSLNPGQWSNKIYTGAGSSNMILSLLFRTSAGEVRPKNMATRIFKRTA